MSDQNIPEAKNGWWFLSVQEAEIGLKTISQENLNRMFTDLVSECIGDSGCDNEYKDVIKYLFNEKHPACKDSAPDLQHDYHNYANADQKANMELLCPDVNFNDNQEL